MPVVLGTNIAALGAQNRLAAASSDLSRTLERLSSGQRINRASDDAAGLSIAMSLNSDIRVYSQGMRNINDGISALNIAQGATTQLTGILQRLKELATQSSNGVFSLSQRLSMDKEAAALANEYNRIIGSTSFNGRMVINGDVQQLGIQAGHGNSEMLLLSVGQGLSRKVGTGTFSQSFTWAGAADGASADINGDGKLDLVVAQPGGVLKTFGVMLGNGDGTFQAVTAVSTSNGASEVITGDFNNDG
jgi:flagellin